MEKNIHDDHLNDYVRKSFEDYEEDPSSDMWDRIEVELTPGTQEPPVHLPVRRYFWQLSAAAVILLLISGLVCGRFYYENRIREIRAFPQVHQQNELPPPYPAQATPHTNKQEQQSGLNTATPNETTSPMNPDTAAAKESNATIQNSSRTSSKQATAPSSASGLSKQEDTKASRVAINRAEQQGKTNNAENQSILDSTPTISAADPLQTNAPLPGGKTDTFKNTTTNLQHAVVDTTAVANNIPGKEAKKQEDSTLKFNDLESIASINTGFVTYSADELNLPIFPVPEQRAASGWYLGLQVTPVFLVEKTVTTRPIAVRPHLVSTQEKTSFSSDYWLKIGKKTKGIWGFESGIGYRAMERNTIHSPRFRLLNGRPFQMGGSQSRSYDFDYDLDTYGGSTEITLRMEQVDANEVIPETEALQFRVKISEKIAVVRVPLLATATWNHRNLGLVCKAGLIGNYIARNQLDILARTSENARLRPGQGSAAYLIQQKNNGKVFMGYQLSAGLEYHLGKHFAWVLEPSIAGDFARKSSAGTRLPSIVPVGINTGLNYYF